MFINIYVFRGLLKIVLFWESNHIWRLPKFTEIHINITKTTECDTRLNSILLSGTAKSHAQDIWSPATSEGEGHYWDQCGGVAHGDFHSDNNNDWEEESGEPAHFCKFGNNGGLRWGVDVSVPCMIELERVCHSYVISKGMASYQNI